MNIKNYTHNSFGCFNTSSALLRGCLFLEATGENNLASAYKIFFRDYEDICINSALISNVFDLISHLQKTSIFFEIWLLDWVMDIESGNRELWLSLNLSEGHFWDVISKESSNFSSCVNESYKMVVERDVWNGFIAILENYNVEEEQGEFEKSFIAVLIITNIMNSF